MQKVYLKYSNTNQSHLDNHVAFVVSSIPIIFYMRGYEKDKRMGEKMQKECSSLCLQLNSKTHFFIALENKDMNIRSHIKCSNNFSICIPLKFLYSQMTLSQKKVANLFSLTIQSLHHSQNVNKRQMNKIYLYRTVCIFVVNEKTLTMRQ